MNVIQAIKLIEEEISSVSDNPKVEANAFLLWILGFSKDKLIMNYKLDISNTVKENIDHFIKKRKEHYPFYYIIGKKEFYMNEFFVNEDVLIPRSETEILVEAVDKILGRNEITIIDLGTGSGCILLTLLILNINRKGIGVDISCNAIRVAQKNADNLNLNDRVKFICSDFNTFTTDMPIDVIVSNPPYVKSKNLKNIYFEPKIALDGGIDGLQYFPNIIKKAFSLLKSGGIIALEIDHDLKEKVECLMKDEGFKEIYSLKDYSGLWRCIIGKKY